MKASEKIPFKKFPPSRGVAAKQTGCAMFCRLFGAMIFCALFFCMPSFAQSVDSLDIDSVSVDAPLRLPTVPPPAAQKTVVPWVALGLDALGAGALIYGLVQNSRILDLQKKYNRLGEGGDFEGIAQQAEDAATLRNGSYIVGTILAGWGLGLHLSVAFDL
jgi:hypothetical protein